jgi:hypothetical protein
LFSERLDIVDIFAAEIKNFSKYKLAKTYVRWTRDNSSGDMHKKELQQWTTLIGEINKALK